MPMPTSTSSRLISRPAPKPPPVICSTSGTARCGTSPGRPTGSRRSSAPTAGGQPSSGRTSRCRRRFGVTGAPAQDLNTAVFVSNDSMAVGVLRAFHEYGRSVPGDVSVVGFDDVPEAAYFSPPLTTVRQDFGEVGRRSLALLLGQIESGTRAAQRHVVETTLVVRDSTTAYTATRKRPTTKARPH